MGYGTSGSEAGSNLRLIDSCITQLKAQEPSRTCNESEDEEEKQTSRPGVEVRANIYSTFGEFCLIQVAFKGVSAF